MIVGIDERTYENSCTPLLLENGDIEYAPTFALPGKNDVRKQRKIRVAEAMAANCVGFLLSQNAFSSVTADGVSLLVDVSRKQSIYLKCCGEPDAVGTYYRDISSILETAKVDAITANIILSLNDGELEQFETEAAYLRELARFTRSPENLQNQFWQL